MSDFSKFLRRFSGEYRGIGHALATLVAGVALQPAERKQATDAIDNIFTAADNIEKSLKNLKETTPSKAQVVAAVKELLPDMLAGMVETQVRAALAAKDKLSKDKPAT